MPVIDQSCLQLGIHLVMRKIKSVDLCIGGRVESQMIGRVSPQRPNLENRLWIEAPAKKTQADNISGVRGNWTKPGIFGDSRQNHRDCAI